MIGPQISIIISAGDAAQRLGLSVKSAVAAGDALGAPFEIVVALADADGPTREVAEALNSPRVRLSAGSAASSRAAAELAWGETVVPIAGGDLISPSYVLRLTSVLGGEDALAVIARPGACMAYGGAPSIRMQESLHGGAVDRARLLFSARFAPPLAAARALLVRLPPRAWTVEADWTWTAETFANGIRHEAVEGAVYVAWTPPVIPVVSLPAASEASAQTFASAWPDGSEMASEAEVAALLYARAAQARLSALEASARSNDDRLSILGKEAARLQASLSAALADADAARRTATALQASTSWKATAPLRALSALAKPRGRR